MSQSETETCRYCAGEGCWNCDGDGQVEVEREAGP